MTISDQKVAKYVERNIQPILTLTERETGDILGLSVSSVSPFWRVAGYKKP